MSTPDTPLAPCPFCGAAAEIVAVGRDWWRLSCSHDEDCMFDADACPTVPKTDEQKRALIADWNRRAPNPLEAELAALRADAERYRHLVATCNINYAPEEPWQLVIWEPDTGEDWKTNLDAAIDGAITHRAAIALQDKRG